MILNKLVEYYDRLSAEPESDIARFGFSRQKISFVVVLNPAGSLSAFQDARTHDGRRAVPRLLVVPGQAKPTGSGLNPGLLWDNAQYMLGYKPDDPKPERTRQAFEAFRDRHAELEEEIGDEAFAAVCRFLRTWRPERAAAHAELAEITAAFGVFRLAGQAGYVHERPKVRDWWLAQVAAADTDAPRAPSLISGQVQPIARLHEPKIKGVRGAQTAGATLVAFNADAYESYRKSQSFNAPVGVEDAFKYCTALNRLTTSRERQVHLGDTTVVFWSERATAFEEDLGDFFEGPLATTTDAEDRGTVKRLSRFFDRLRRASAGDDFEDGDVPFYVLGLAPNAARISVRFWLRGTVQEFAERLGRHLADMELSGAPPKMPPITLQRIIDQTARERDDIQPLLGGALLRSVLTGGPYPMSLIGAVLHRLRADRQLDGWSGHIRAAILKANLVRNARLRNQDEEINMSLDESCRDAAYNAGRLFCAFEQAQIESHKPRKLDRTIVDGFIAAASSTPAVAFPRLLKLNRHHMASLPTSLEERRARGCYRLRNYYERLVDQICGNMSIDHMPQRFEFDEQSRFFIGYYHQRQALFTSSKTTDAAASDPANEE